MEQHVRDRVHAQAVHVIPVQPEQRAAQQKAAHLGPAVVEQGAFPGRVIPAARVGMRIDVRAVKKRKRVIVVRKMKPYPVEDHSEAVPVQVIHEIHEILRRAVAAGRGVKARRLIPPRVVKRVFHDRQQFHMSEPHPRKVLREFLRQFAVVQPAVALLGDTHPRTGMQLVDADRLVAGLALGTRRHPLPVAPAVFQGPHHRGGTGRFLVPKRHGITLVHAVTSMMRNDVVLVAVTGSRRRHKPRPHPGIPDRLQRMRFLVPPVEIADHRHGLGIRRPHGKPNARLGFRARGMRAQFFVQTAVRARAEGAKRLCKGRRQQGRHRPRSGGGHPHHA